MTAMLSQPSLPLDDQVPCPRKPPKATQRMLGSVVPQGTRTACGLYIGQIGYSLLSIVGTDSFTYVSSALTPAAQRATSYPLFLQTFPAALMLGCLGVQDHTHFCLVPTTGMQLYLDLTLCSCPTLGATVGPCWPQQRVGPRMDE